MLTLDGLRTGITLVTGTDTDAGKTVATAVLAAWMERQGSRTVVCKPAQTGLASGEPGDLAQVGLLTGLPDERLVEFVRLPEPLAPTTAGRRAGVELPGVDELAERLVSLAGGCDALLVEGAGGVLVGLDSQGRTVLDLAEELTRRGHAPRMVLVTRAGLGTLNHTALSLQAIAARGLGPTALVIGAWPETPGLAERCNAEELPMMAPVLATLPAGIGDDPQAVARLATALDAHAQNLPTQAVPTEATPKTQEKTMDLDQMTRTALAGEPITREQALQVLQAPDAMTLPIVAAAGQVRRHFFGNQLLVNHLVNIKSGMCPEDCSYCSQALDSKAGILRYSWLPREEIEKAVRAGVSQGASTVCLVASGRGPSRREVELVAGIVEEIKAEYPQVTVCTCLGFLDDEKAARLKEAGSDRYNHNLNTAEDRYEEICSTHSFADRADTVNHARNAGMDACSGLIAGMGETDGQLVDVVFSLRELGARSVPVNFLLPFEGTPLASHRELTPQRCLRILAMVRLVHPDAEVRAAAGREYHLRSLQPLVLEVCNSIFLGDYLTSEGQEASADLQMIRDAGFEIKGQVSGTVVQAHAGLPSVTVKTCGSGQDTAGGCGGGCGSGAGCGSGHHDAGADDHQAETATVDAAGVPIRRRGPGAV